MLSRTVNPFIGDVCFVEFTTVRQPANLATIVCLSSVCSVLLQSTPEPDRPNSLSGFEQHFLEFMFRDERNRAVVHFKTKEHLNEAFNKVRELLVSTAMKCVTVDSVFTLIETGF